MLYCPTLTHLQRVDTGTDVIVRLLAEGGQGARVGQHALAQGYLKDGGCQPPSMGPATPTTLRQLWKAQAPKKGGSLGWEVASTPPGILGPPHASWSRCTSLEGRVGGNWSRKACCLRGRREGVNLQTEQGLLKPCPSPAILHPCPSSHLPTHSLVIANTDDGPHQERSLHPSMSCPPGSPSLCFRWALSV